MSEPQFRRGAIVRAEGFMGVLWQPMDDGAVVLPIERASQNQRHRSDAVGSDEPLLWKRVIRAGSPVKVKAMLTVVEHVSEKTISGIQLAMRREADARRFEDRHHVKIEAPSHQSVRF